MVGGQVPQQVPVGPGLEEWTQARLSGIYLALSLAGFKAASTLQNTGGTHMAPKPSAFPRLTMRQACSPLITWVSHPRPPCVQDPPFMS